MIPELGHFALALAVALAVAQAAVPLWGAWRRDARLMAAAPPLAVSQLIALAASFACLTWASVVNDFSVLNVAENSHSLKPLLYKVTGTWGNHEGSTLLWCLILAMCGGAVAAFGTNLPSALRARVIGVLGGSACGFELFALLESNPFARLWPPPLDGRDMNPLLQDPGLAFHPPILYVGYVGFAVPFAFAVAALLEGRIDAAWGRWVRPWALAAWCFLTGGIALGSWWAYYELGWGGFWFWDPVENASLLPWLTGTALLHSAIVVEKREALKTWTVLLAIATFALSLSGTFMVRSGILNSVHSFANDPARGLFILVLLGLVIGGSLLLFALRAPVLAASGVFAPISREGSLVLNNILLCSIAAVVLTGTLYPLFAELAFGAKLSVGAPFFNSTVLPLAVPVFAAMSLGPVLSWKRAALGPALLRLWWALLVALVVGSVASVGARALPALAFGGSAWILCGAVAGIVERVQLFRVPLGSSLSRLAALPRAVFGTTLGHAGMGVTIAGIAGMSLAVENIALVKPGESVALAGFDWKLIELHDADGPNYAARVATIEVSREGRPVTVLSPSRRNFPVQRMTTSEAAIETNFFRDLYAVLGDEREGAAVLRLHYNPLAPWIWLGALVMAAGGMISLADRRLRVGGAGPPRDRNAGWRLGPRMNRRLLLMAPFGVAVAGGAGFLAMLNRMQSGTFDPHGVPSMLIGKPVPSFALPGQEGDGFASTDLSGGRPVVINFFASWCVPCVEEAPVLMDLKKRGVPIYGIAYKDAAEATRTFLHSHGDPYARIARDAPGRVAIDFGLTGVPETYLIDGHGVVRWRFVGPMTEDAAAGLPALLRQYA